MINLNKDDGGVFQLTGEANIHNVEALRGQLGALDQSGGSPLTISLGGLREVDTAGLQVLLAFKRRADGEVSYVSCPKSIQKVIAVFGLEELLL